MKDILNKKGAKVEQPKKAQTTIAKNIVKQSILIEGNTKRIISEGSSAIGNLQKIYGKKINLG